MKDIAAARNFRHGQGLSGPQSAARVGDGGLGVEALVLQFQQAEAPGVAVAMFLQAQQVAVGGIDVGPDQHRPPALEDLVVGADADAGQVLLPVVRAGLRHGPLKDVVDLADRDRIVQQVAAELADPADGTVADQRQPEDQLARSQALVTGR